MHSTMAPHGPDANTFHKGMMTGGGSKKASGGNSHLSNNGQGAGARNLAFMLETNKMLKLTDFAMTTEFRDVGYSSSWHGLEGMFKRSRGTRM